MCSRCDRGTGTEVNPKFWSNFLSFPINDSDFFFRQAIKFFNLKVEVWHAMIDETVDFISPKWISRTVPTIPLINSFFLCRQYQGDDSTKPFCSNLSEPMVVRQFVFYDVVTKLHTPDFIL